MPVDPKSLVPTHLVAEGTSSADLKAQVTAQLTPETPPEDDRKTRMKERAFTFPFKFTDGNGKEYAGTFTNRVPDIRTRQAIGVLRAQLTGGVGFDSLDPFTRELTLLVATLTFSLEDKGRPEWAKDFQKVENVQVLRALYEEVAAHEATFLGL